MIDADRELIRQHEVAIAEAEAEKVEAGAFEAGGGTPEEGQRRFDEAEQKIARHRALIAQRETVIEARKAEIVRLERGAEHAAYREVYVELEAACEQAGKLSGTLGRKLGELLKVVPELVAARERVADLKSEAHERCPDSVDFVLAENADEPTWPGDAETIKQLVATITAGPRRPFADEATRAEQAATEAERRTRSSIRMQVAQALSGGRFAAIGRLPEEDWPEAWRLFKAELAAWVERRRAEAREGGQIPAAAARQLAQAEALLSRDVADLVAETASRRDTVRAEATVA